MRTVPGNPDAGGERRRRVAVVAGSVALAAIALGAGAGVDDADDAGVYDAAGDPLPAGDRSGALGGAQRSLLHPVCPIGSRHRVRSVVRSAVVRSAVFRTVHGAGFVTARRGRRAVAQPRLPRPVDRLAA
jgi:hypothetical protein